MKDMHAQALFEGAEEQIPHLRDPAAEEASRLKHRDWMVTQSLMSLTRRAYFMHCLPVRRNVVVADDVIDSAQSVVFDQAENRLHAQKAILDWIYSG